MNAKAVDTPTDRRSGWLRSWWLVFALNPFWTQWISFVYIGLRAKRPQWIAWGAVYGAIALGSVILVDQPGILDGIGVTGTFAVWLVALVHALVVRNEYLERLDVLEDPRLTQARLLSRGAASSSRSSPERTRGWPRRAAWGGPTWRTRSTAGWST